MACVRPSRHTLSWMRAARRNLMNHAAKLRRAFDALSVISVTTSFP